MIIFQKFGLFSSFEVSLCFFWMLELWVVVKLLVRFQVVMCAMKLVLWSMLGLGEQFVL